MRASSTLYLFLFPFPCSLYPLLSGTRVSYTRSCTPDRTRTWSRPLVRRISPPSAWTAFLGFLGPRYLKTSPDCDAGVAYGWTEWMKCAVVEVFCIQKFWYFFWFNFTFSPFSGFRRVVLNGQHLRLPRCGRGLQPVRQILHRPDHCCR